MVDTYTPNLRFTKPEIDANDDLWAPLLNDGLIQLIDDALASEHVADVTGGNLILSENDGATDEGRAMFIRVIGTPGVTRNIVTSTLALSKLYVVKNDSDSQVNVGPNGGIALSIPVGKIVMCWNEFNVGCFEVVTDGDTVDLVVGGLTTITVNIVGAGGGDLTLTMKYMVQGSMAYVNFDRFASTNFSDGLMRFTNAAGDWPSVIVPATSKEFVGLIYEDTGGGFNKSPAMFRVNSDPSGFWEYFNVNGASFTAAADRTVDHSLTMTYPVQGI